MRRNLGIVSLIIGVLFLGVSVGLNMITKKARVNQEAVLHERQMGLELAKEGLRRSQEAVDKTAAPQEALQDTFLEMEEEFTQQIVQSELEISEASDKLEIRVQNERLAKRFLFFGIGVGLYLCLLQAPFLMITGRQG